MYYSREWGFILWEEYIKSNDSQPRNISIFNKTTSKPTAPNKSVACIRPPTPTPTPTPAATPIPGLGDGNGDGKIDLTDLSILLSDFNKTSGFRTGIDLNKDGKINTFDFSLMRNLLIQKGIIRG
jgi:hypothetical protein